MSKSISPIEKLNSQNHKNDAEIRVLILGCTQNSRKEQKQLFEWLNEYAVAICYRYATNVTEVQDLVSDGFMKVYKNIGQYNGSNFGYSENLFKGWFKRVLINNCINYLKKFNQPIISTDFNDYTKETYANNEEDVLSMLNRKDLLQGVKELPPIYKTVFSLFAIDGYTHEEISMLLGISIGASKSNLFKARQHLQKFYAAP